MTTPSYSVHKPGCPTILSLVLGAQNASRRLLVWIPGRKLGNWFCYQEDISSGHNRRVKQPDGRWKGQPSTKCRITLFWKYPFLGSCYLKGPLTIGTTKGAQINQGDQNIPSDDASISDDSNWLQVAIKNKLCVFKWLCQSHLPWSHDYAHLTEGTEHSRCLFLDTENAGIGSQKLYFQPGIFGLTISSLLW